MRTDEDIEREAQEIVNEVWTEIGFDSRLSILVIAGLIDGCLRSAGPQRDLVSKLLQFNFIDQPFLERAH